MFKLFKKDSDAAPDVGQEDEYDAEHAEEVEEEGDVDNSVPKEVVISKVKVATNSEVGSRKSEVGGVSSAEIERLNAKVDSVVEWIKQFYERFAYVSESIGQVKAMSIANEKKISSSMAEAEKAVDIVKEVKPADLRIEYQKAELRVATLAEKIEFNKRFMTEVINEVNEIKKKSEIFIGVEALIKLNEDTKKELVKTNTLSAKSKMQADKVQEIFMEVRKSFAEAQKTRAVVDSFEASYSGLKTSIDKLGLDFSNVVKRDDYLDFKKEYGKKLASYDVRGVEIADLKKNIETMSSLVETSLSVSRRNEEDIGNIGVKIGEGSVKGVSGYENQMAEMLDIIEVLSKQVGEVREKVGLKAAVVMPKILVEPVAPVVPVTPVAPVEEIIPATKPIEEVSDKKE